MSPLWLIGALAAYFLILLGVSLYKRRTDTETDYFLGGNTMPAWMLAMAFVATWYGGNSALISVDEANTQGMGSWWVLGGPTVIAVIALFALGPIIRRAGMLSQDGIMTSRYNKTAGTVLSIVTAIYLVVWGASQMVALGLFFMVFFEISFAWGVAVAITFSLAYAMIGGFRAVVLTETAQFGFFLLGLIVTFVGAVIVSGGPDAIIQTIEAKRDAAFLNLWEGFGPNLGYVIAFGLAFTIDPAAWQRLQATRSPKEARKVTVHAMIYFLPLYFLVVFAGIASIAAFNEPPEQGLVATLATSHFLPIFGVIVFIGIAAAIMSTICTTLNLSSLYLTELTTKALRRDVAEKQKVWIARGATLLAAVIGFVVAVQLPSALTLLALASEMLAAGVFFPLVLGFFWRRANSAGAIASIIGGGGFILYGFLIELGIALPSFWGEGSVTRVLIGLGISFVLYVSVSLSTSAEFAKAAEFVGRSRGNSAGSAAASGLNGPGEGVQGHEPNTVNTNLSR